MKLPDHLFVSMEGDLYDTRCPNWSSRPPLRRDYQKHSSRIKNTLQLRAALREGPFAFPGGYVLSFITSDGALLCFDCVRDNYRSVSDSVRNGHSDGWRVVSLAINYDGEDDEFCDHCGKQLAFGDSDES